MKTRPGFQSLNKPQTRRLQYALAVTCIALFCLISESCKEDIDAIPAQEYQTGKNRFTLSHGGDEREFYVHVPAAYHPDDPVPMVFMLHGTSGDGEKFYNISGWKEVGEAENILTVYPSSWRYCVIDDGQVKNTTKWNVLGGTFEFCPGEVPRDDIGFFRVIITDLTHRFSIDPTRIYVVGFSNGGQMAGRCAVEMSDVFAAASQNAGSIPFGETYTPLRNLPVMFQFGNSDNGFAGGPDVEIPMNLFDSVLTIPAFASLIQTHVSTFDLDTDYTISGNPDAAMIATFNAADQSTDREFLFIMVKGLEHNYPNGTNHWMHGAERHWEWLRKFQLL